ncbi:MAG TPA: tRNA epoxyqueuosine(34) reductase QueG, partial [Pseudomonadales bacterium]
MTDIYAALAEQIRQWGRDAGFQQVGITDVNVDAYREHYQRWLASHYHGEMDYMQRHEALRLDPAQLQPGCLRAISFRMDYYHDDAAMRQLLDTPDKAYIARYAVGRDYHKLVRKRLAAIAARIGDAAEAGLSQRAFVDSAPVLERALAEKSALGWIGKNTMLINSRAGSYFFLGEILTDLPLPVDKPQADKHCGSCTACLDVCPTGAFAGPWQLDARRCISYLTIELKGVIPETLRPLMGNRVFGCDDCQIVCPWNKFARGSNEPDFRPRHGLDNSELLQLYLWDEQTFLRHTEGSPIRRIGYQRWLRNLAVGLGNAPYSAAIVAALQADRRLAGSELDEHRQWALQQQEKSAVLAGRQVD